MPEVRLLKVKFDLPLKQYQVPGFRGAIINLVGREKTSFHNHLDNKSYQYSYPTIQYKINHSKATLLCLNDGVEELFALFQNDQQTIQLYGKKVELKVEDIRLSKPFIEVWDKSFNYRINDWLPLNTKNFKTYLELDSEIERLEMLENILKGNILSMAKGLGWKVDKQIELKITKKIAEKQLIYKKVKMKGMIVSFKTNVFLPNQIGIGKGASTGFGVINTLHKKEKIHE